MILQIHKQDEPKTFINNAHQKIFILIQSMWKSTRRQKPQVLAECLFYCVWSTYWNIDRKQGMILKRRNTNIFRSREKGHSLCFLSSLALASKTFLSVITSAPGNASWGIFCWLSTSSQKNQSQCSITLSTILHWSDMSCTIWTMLSSAVRIRVGPKTIARFRTSILLMWLLLEINFRCLVRNWRTAKWCSGKLWISRLMLAILSAGSGVRFAWMNDEYCSDGMRGLGNLRKNDFRRLLMTLTSRHLCWRESKRNMVLIRLINIGNTEILWSH